MIWFIIGFIIAAIIIIFIWFDDWNDLFDKISISLIVLLIFILTSSLVFLLASAVVSSNAEIKYNLESDTKIIALKDNQNVSGSFYIMGGHINEDLYYYYATETEFGYKTEKVRAGNAYIKYTDGETHIEKYVGEFANDSLYLWGDCLCDNRFIIYCPEGTVTNEFNVDLE